MKKKLLVFGLTLGMLLGVHTTAFADVNASITLKEDGSFVGDHLDLDEFDGMAPGDTRYQVIDLHNEMDHQVNFYVKQSTLKNLEETNQSAGGAYKFDLFVGNTKETANSVLATQVGGYNASGVASAVGLSNIEELEEYVFIASLEAGESTQVYLQLEIQGEGNDNHGSKDYTNAVGELQLNFRAMDAKRVVYGKNMKITNTIQQRIFTTETRRANTGDSNRYLMFVGILGAGVLLIIVALLVSKKGAKNEKKTS